MSHYYMPRPVKKYIFIGLSEKQMSLAKSLKEEYPENDSGLYLIFMKNTDEIIYHLDPNTIVISSAAMSQQVIETILKLGHPFYLTWSEFLQHYYTLINYQCKSGTRKICLAFIPDNFMKLYKSLMSTYGFSVVVATDALDLDNIMNSGLEYLVFDMDMGQASEKVRFQTMQKISYHCKKGLKVNVIKNFDKGSLFNDILSPVKEINNILLSPEEYMVFLRKYLYVKELENFYADHPDRINAFQNNRHGDEFKNTVKTASDTFMDIRDGKKCYNQIIALKDNKKWQENLQKKNDIELRFTLSRAIENFVSQNLENSQRELFTFFPQ